MLKIAQKKEYIALFKLGETTPSFDLESEIDNTYPTNHITDNLLKDTIQKFIGKQQQIPPIFSAKKINGVRAYTKARKGQEVKLKASDIEIFDIKILDFKNPFLELKISCSKGTYIRAFARDIGKALDSGAYLHELRRTAIGNYSVKDAMSLDFFEKML